MSNRWLAIIMRESSGWGVQKITYYIASKTYVIKLFRQRLHRSSEQNTWIINIIVASKKSVVDFLKA